VIRFSILNFSIGFPNFFKLLPKMLYLGPIYPKIGALLIPIKKKIPTLATKIFVINE
jgi:hypothetical protein